MGVSRQIIGSFEDIGKDIVREAVKVPKDIAGKAIESLGTSSGKKQGQQNVQSSPADKPALNQLDQMKDNQVRYAVARAALEELSGKKPKQKEPSVWERIQIETEQKKNQKQQHAVAAAAAALPKIKSARPRGDLYGIKTKRAAAEMSRNVRQD